jgi:hypothetical protein
MSAEIDWQDEPAQVAPGTRVDLIRCGTGSLPPLIALNSRHIGAELHFWQGRSFPHIKTECPACAAKNGCVWKGYIGVWNPSTRATGILEFTLGCVTHLDAYFIAHQTCRGATISLKRSNGKANGKLIMTCTRSIWANDQLPPAPDLRKSMSLMWNANRVDHLINTNPTRPVVEAPTTSSEVLQRRRNLDAMLPETTGERTTISLQDAGRLLATRFAMEGEPKNGKGENADR